MRIEAGRTFYGKEFKAKVEVDPLPKKPKPGDTATHEAMHIVAALANGTGVEGASIIPGPGYLGITYLSKPDAVAALAPHSMGASGTSYDVFMASQIGGSSGAESSARAIIHSNSEKVEAVASMLEEKKSAGSNDIQKAIDEVDHPLPRSGTIFIEDSKGKVEKKKVEVRDNIVILPENWLESFPLKPKIN